jgi:serine/threonine protein kinase
MEVVCTNGYTFKIESEIVGQGSNGTIISATHEGMPIVVKRCLDRTEAAVFEDLLRTYKQDEWPRGIVHVYGVARVKGYFYLAMKRYVSNMRTYHRAMGTYVKEKMEYFVMNRPVTPLIMDLFLGYDAIMKAGWLYQQIAERNILVDEHGHLCIADFGHMRRLDQPIPRYFIYYELNACLTAVKNIVDDHFWNSPDLHVFNDASERIKLLESPIDDDYKRTDILDPKGESPELRQIMEWVADGLITRKRYRQFS